MSDLPNDPSTPPAQPIASTPEAPGSAPTPAADGTTGLAPNVAAGLSVLLTLITGIIFLVIEKRNAFVRFWAMQATLFGALGIVFNIALQISFYLVHWSMLLTILLSLLALAVTLALFVIWVIMLIQAFSGKEWEVPILGKLARQQLTKLPPV